MRISDILAKWYEVHKRDLPWRKSSNPYVIWVSEIILQQTRVNQGTQYFIRFLEQFPDVHSLAYAPLDKVLKVWEGLGYYSRARNMHVAAKQIVNDYNGRFPTNFEELKKLKGIGDYTAAAIASIAFQEPVALVDGNVYRVLSRLQGIFTPINSGKGKKQFFQLASRLIDRQQPGLFNQALMEFGAIHCVPRNPGCPSCVFQDRCYAFQNDCVQDLPVKSKSKKTRTRYFYYFLIRNGDTVYVQQRKAKDIWQELYQFPLVERQKRTSIQDIIGEFEQQWQFKSYKTTLKSPEYKHQLTHQHIRARLIIITVDQVPHAFSDHFVAVHSGNLDRYAFPRLLCTLMDNHITLKK